MNVPLATRRWSLWPCSGIAPLIVTICVAGPVHATGFAIEEQDAVALGTAQAGRAALADNPATVFYNPAGMTRLSGTQAALSGIYIGPTGDFDNAGSSLGAVPLTGGDGGAFSSDAFVPTLYLTTGVSERLKLGIGVSVPFGLGTDYDPDWVGRYHTIEADLRVVNINPAIAYRLTETLSIGGGIDVQYLDAELSNAIDFGSLLGFPQALDGRATLSGDNWAVGYNLGLLYEPSPRLRLGLTYRSRVKHDVDVDADFDAPAAAAPIQAAGLFTDTGGSTEVTLPESVSLSAYYDVTPRWALLADVTWTRWSRFDELAVEFDNPLQPAIVEEQDWDDTVRISLGAAFRPTERWVLRAGIAYDESPIPDEFQRPRLVVGDRVLVGVGAGYRLSDTVRLDIGYMHSFSEDVEVDISNPGAGRLVGDYDDLGANLFAAQLSVRF
jgi:long-chain fatty acid transport protein